MTEHVWVCTAPSGPTLADIISRTDINLENDDLIIEVSRTARLGGVLEPGQFPSQAWGEVGDYRRHAFGDRWPDFFYCAGMWIMTGQVAEIIRRCDLGSGSIRPLRLFRKDHGSTAPADRFIWNIGNVKNALLPEESQGLRVAGGRAFAVLDAQDHDIKCSQAAGFGPDIWIDAKLRGTIFLSRSLGEALRDAGLATEQAGFGTLIQCDLAKA